MNTDTNTPINWEEVKNYYLACRSYKLTAEHFGISTNTIHTRSRREKWSSVSFEPSAEVQANLGEPSAEVQVNLGEPSAEVQVNLGEPSAEPHKVQNEPRNSQLEPPTSFPQLPALANLTSKEVTLCTPWEAPVIARNKLPNKEAYRAYIQNPATSDFLISGVLGEAANLRVSRDNPPARMLAVVADYDLELSYEKREKLLSKLTTRPNFICRSYSGGTHAVWFFENPLPLPCDAEAQERLLTIIRKKLKLDNAFGALDANAFNKLSQVYHAGWDWRLVHDTPIAEERTLAWLMDALSKVPTAANEVPMSVVAAEVERRFPGRWQGDFTEGARGVRFWDAQADNPTAAIVTRTGMVCFTGPFSWRSWEDIFGKDFLAQYRENKLGKLLKECFVVNNTFYVKGSYQGAPCWQSFNRQNMESLLSSLYGLRSRVARGEDQSEVKEAVSTLLRMNTLYAARPFIYDPNTVLFSDGKPVLNTSLLRVHKPNEDKGKFWGDGFPWIASFLDSLFPDLMQRDRFMSEWAYAYRHAYAGKPKNGRVTFIAGDVGVGKNFLTECLVGPSLGGYADPSPYLLGQTRFNDSLFDVGVWICNDTVTKGDDRERQIFTASLKRIAANMQHIWEGKFKGACKINWSGRVYVTLNTDPVSLQILPDLDQSNKDKISLYRVSGPPLNDPQAPAKAKAELGALCAYLLTMEFPEHCRDGARWGVKNFLHPDLKAEADSSSTTASFGEIMTLYCRNAFAADPAITCLEGPATWFLQKMLEQPALKEMLRGCESPKSFGRRMAALANTGTFPVTYRRTTTERRWCVERAAFEHYIHFGNPEGDLDDEMPF